MEARDVRVGPVAPGVTFGTPAIAFLGRDVSVNFGTVLNGTGGAATITVEVDARVIDVAGVNAGADLSNGASLDFTVGGRPGEVETSVPSVLVEPELVVTKTVDSLTGDAGDTFTYTVTIAHAATSTSAAYDIVVTDVLDARLLPVSVTASVGTATIAGSTIRLAVDRFALTDAPIVLTYVVEMADTVEPGQVIGNTANLGWDSDPDDTLGRPDSSTASAPNLTAVFSLDLEKTVFSTTLTETGDTQWRPGVPDLAIGEVVIYELAVTLAEGTQRLVVRDEMPEGFLPLADPLLTRVVATGGILAGAGGTLAPTVLIVGRDVTFDFGTLVNPGTDRTAPSDPADVIRIRIAARVLDEPINTDGRPAANSATAQVTAPTDPSAPGGTLTDNDSADVDIVLPALDIAKSVDIRLGDAGDVFTYTLIVSNLPDATGPAYNLVITDVLPGVLEAVPGSVLTSAGTATILGNTIRVEIPVLLPDAAPIMIMYRAAFTDAIEPGQIVPNTADLGYSTAPTDGRPFADSDSEEVRGNFGVLLDKTIFATSLPETGSAFFDPSRPDIAAGESITYRLVATLNEGTQTLVIRDAMPAGLVAESARVVALGAGIIAGPPTITIAGSSVVFDFGTIVNTGAVALGDTIEVEIVARRDASQPAGAVLTNGASVTVTSPSDPSVILTAGDSVSVDAVAAVLAFDKTAAPLSVALGNTITYTLVLSHAPGSTAPAYEVVLADPLSDASVRLVVGSVVASAGTVVSGNNGGDSTVRVELPVLLPGQTLTVTFQALAVGVPIPDGNSINTASFDSNSAPGPLPPGFGIPVGGNDSAVVAIASSAVEGRGGLLDAFNDAFRRTQRNVLDVPAILAGTAQPGAAVALRVQDASGAPINIVGVTADAGGHWMANPIATVAPGARDDGALAEALYLAGRQRTGEAIALPLPPAPPQIPTPTTAPYTVQAAEAPAAFDQRAGMDGVRVTFGGAVQPGGIFVAAPDAPASVGTTPITAFTNRDQTGLQAPQSLAWNRFALDFAAATTAASVAAR
jgi:uncharacterized repeat protein (TIGR01451 family)/fimbrial isopeptide formation D2 family protein